MGQEWGKVLGSKNSGWTSWKMLGLPIKEKCVCLCKVFEVVWGDCREKIGRFEYPYASLSSREATECVCNSADFRAKCRRVCLCAQSVSRVWLFATTHSVACQLLCSWDFLARILDGLPFPTPEDFSNPGIEPMSPESLALAGGFFITEPPGKPDAGKPAVECR